MYSVGLQVRRTSLEFYSFDQEYLSSLVDGDRETERHFVAYFSELLNIKLRQRLRTQEEVEDLKQEVFLRVFRSLRMNSLSQAEKLGAFVNAVCNHVLLEHYRALGKKSEIGASWEEHTPEPVEPSAGSEAKLLGEETRSQVRLLLGALSRRDQAILRAVFFEEKDKDSVCASHGVGRDYLRVLLHRAKNRLRGMMDQTATGRP